VYFPLYTFTKANIQHRPLTKVTKN